MKRVVKINKCRICKNTDLIPCIDLGKQYLSSVFPENLDYYKHSKKYPLDLVLCKKKEDTCGTLQLAHNIDLESMYELYPFSSSTNSSMPALLKDIVDSALPFVEIKKDDVILDIGGNDGTLLSYFKDKNVDLLAIDPAKNIKQIFKSPRYTYINDFFNRKTYQATENKNAKLIFSIAMFYHLSDPVNFSKDVKECLDDDGVWVIQMAYLPLMLETNMYDNIVHEHAGYYTVHNMEWIMEKAGLEIFDVTLNDVYGGSFRIFVKKKNNKKLKKSKGLMKILQNELTIGVDKVQTYTNFMRNVEQTKEDLLALIKRIKSEKKTIWIYGASTKGNTILQYCGITNKDIEAAADSNPFKFNKYIIGTNIPIKDEEVMRNAKPDYLLALPYSFVEGFMKREKKLVESGTKFIVPLPNVAVYPKKV
jgi:hypothetical protein